jgi:AcrR family transcriptional regulator
MEMPRDSRGRTQARREEIVGACESLYETMGFREVTIKKVSERTSFSRPSIYNYFETKEEIFLALLQREYETWADELERIPAGRAEMSTDELASAIAETLERRTLLLKIQAMNLYEIEDNSRLERLVDFKKSFCRAMNAVDGCLVRFLPQMTPEERLDFRYSFFPFICGVYPYVFPTRKQLDAMAAAGIPVRPTSIGELTRRCLKKLLSAQKST